MKDINDKKIDEQVINYSLTNLRKSICPIIYSLEEWGNRVYEEGKKN